MLGKRLLVFVFGVAVSCIGTAVVAGQSITYLPTIAGIPPQQIAFVSERDDNYEIYLMNVDGSSQTNLTNNEADDTDPTWSPDGSRIAFVRSDDIFVMRFDGSNQTSLTGNPAIDRDPVWSPDGKRIAFISNRDGNFEIYVMDADGNNQTNLTDNPAHDLDHVWSPDGNKIAFSSDRDGDREIFVMDADGGNQVQLTDNQEEDVDPTWSPHGDSIVFGKLDESIPWPYQGYYISSVKPAGGDEMVLTEYYTRGRGPRWSPDGAKILFHCGWRMTSLICVMNADGSGQIEFPPDLSYSAAWSPDGRKIAYVQGGLWDYQDPEIFVMNADGSNPQALTSNEVYDGVPVWSPLGRP